jgi:hypothetical protein
LSASGGGGGSAIPSHRGLEDAFPGPAPKTQTHAELVRYILSAHGLKFRPVTEQPKIRPALLLCALPPFGD